MMFCERTRSVCEAVQGLSPEACRSGLLRSHPPRKTIGILGGSFNPAHSGHVHLSQQAMKRLGLDGVVWLVSPANPLKEASGLAPYEQRFAKAQEVASADPRIMASDFEERMGLRYSVDVVRALMDPFCDSLHSKGVAVQRFLLGVHHSGFAPRLSASLRVLRRYAPRKTFRPLTRYIFLIGADNLACFHQWKGWEKIFHSIPIAVFDRAPHSHGALRSKAAQKFCTAQLPESNAHALKYAKAPAWCYIHMPRDPLSATYLRKMLGEDAFLVA